MSLPAGFTTDWWVYSQGTGQWYGPLYLTTGTGSPIPPAPTLLAPSGTAPDCGPVFTWTASAAATSYRLWIDGLYDTTFTAEQLGCTSGTCTTPSIPLPSGATATWFVNASNDLGGTWSTSKTFVVGPMVAATLLGPSGGTSADTAPVFTWTAAPGGTSYRLWIADLYDQTFTASALGCAGGGTCTTDQISLPAGAPAQWYVEAFSGADFAWSTSYTFTVGATAPVPGAATLLGPTGSSPTTGPVFTWTGSGAATSHRLWIDGLYDHTFTASELGCASGGTCTTGPISLPADATAHWYVNSSNASGDTWSGGAVFTVGSLPGAVDQLSPSGTVSGAQVFTWSATSDAETYRLWIDGVWDETYAPEELGCASGTCSTEAISLPSGVRSWYVQTENASGATWSSGLYVNAT